jgi:hypothetical protein
MEKHQSIISYLLTFLLILILFKILGVVNLYNTDLLSYLLVFLGLSYAYNSFGNNRKGILFASTVVFLIGLMLFVISNFEIQQVSKIILPSSMMIIGIGLLMIYIDGHKVTYLFVLSLLFILVGVIISITRGRLTFISFLSSGVSIAGKYWPFLVIFAGILLLYRKRKS